MSVHFMPHPHEFVLINHLPEIDRMLYLHHGWRWVVFAPNGKPVGVHSSKGEAERYSFEAEIER